MKGKTLQAKRDHRPLKNKQGVSPKCLRRRVTFETNRLALLNLLEKETIIHLQEKGRGSDAL